MNTPRSRDTSAREKLHREADRRWSALERQHPELAETIPFGRRLVMLFIDERPVAPPFTLTATSARAKLAAGLPLLDEETLDFDLPSLRRFAFLLCEWAAEQTELTSAAGAIAGALTTGLLTVEQLLTAAIGDADREAGTLAEQRSLDPVLFRTLADLTLSAALMDLAQRLTPLLHEATIPWNAPICPICGGAPLLGELQGSEGTRMLRCATCGGGWRALISHCAHCGTADSAMLHYLAAEGEEGKYRVDLCDRCHGYVKAVTTFAATPPELLLIDDTALLHLEREAQVRGYTAHPDVDLNPQRI